MRKMISISVAVLAVAGLLAFGRSRLGSSTATDAATTTAAVQRGSIRTLVSCTGTVTANQTVEIKCKASGEVKALPYDISDAVHKGDLLIQLDPADEERLVRQAEASLAASLAKLETARINLSVARKEFSADKRRAESNLKSAQVKARDARAKASRLRDLLGQKISSPEEVETAETTASQLDVDLDLAQIAVDDLARQEEALDLKVQDVKLAEAQVVSDKLTVEIRKQSYEDTRVVAPIEGVVSARTVQIGQIISSGISNVGGGTTALTLSDLSSIFILASVDETDIGKVLVGQEAIITADAFPGSTFQGVVRRVATQGTSTSNVVTFEVKVEVVSDNKTLLKPQMTTNLTIAAAHKDDVLLIPVLATIRKGKDHFVQVVGPDGQNKETKVQIGMTDGTSREVISGLAEGDTVVVNKDTTDSKWSNQQMGPPPMGPPPGGSGRGGR